MSSKLRRRSALALSAVAAASLVVPLAATSASAAPTGTEVQVFTATDANQDTGIYRRNADATVTTIAAPTTGVDRSELTSSADATRFAYVEDVYDSTSTLVRTRIVVRDMGGQTVRVVDDLAANDGDTELDTPALSPDGNTVVWTRVTHNNTTTPAFSLRKMALATSTQVQLSSSLVGSAFLDASTLLSQQSADGTFVTIPLAGGSTQPVQGAPDVNVQDVAVSHDGTKLAWSLDTTDYSANPVVATSTLQVADASLSGGALTLSSPRALVSTLDNTSPAFSPDDLQVRFVRWDGNTGPSDLYTVPTDGSTGETALGSTTAADEYEVETGVVDDGTAPGLTDTSAAFTLAGTSATIRWGLPADTDLSGVLVSRNGGAARYYPAPVSSFVDTGLALGASYTYSFQSVDRSGNLAAASTRSLTAATPGFAFTDPTSTGSVTAPFVVRFGPTSPSSIHWTVTYRLTTSSTFSSWVSGVAGAYRTFGVAGTTGVASTTATPGSTYQFRAFATDAYGNSTGTATSGAAVVPWDQTKATLSGGRNLAQSADYLGSVRVLNAAGNYARIGITGNRFSIIGQRCSTCGVFDVYDGSTRVATIDSRASSTQFRVVLFTRYYSSVQAHTLTIRARGTAGRPNVVLDGFAVRR